MSGFVLVRSKRPPNNYFLVIVRGFRNPVNRIFRAIPHDRWKKIIFITKSKAQVWMFLVRLVFRFPESFFAFPRVSCDCPSILEFTAFVWVSKVCRRHCVNLCLDFVIFDKRVYSFLFDKRTRHKIIIYFLVIVRSWQRPNPSISGAEIIIF